jgi:PAS domain S-box-containing protein
MLAALQDAADAIGLGIIVLHIGPPQRVIYANEPAAAIFGRSLADMKDSSPIAMLAPEVQEREQGRLDARGPREAPPTVFESMALRPDGVRVPIEIGSTRVVTASATLVIAFVRDNSARFRALEAIKQSEERFRDVIENAPDGVVIIKRGRIDFLNDIASRMFGAADRSQLIGHMVSEYLKPEDGLRAAERIAKMLTTGVTYDPSEYTTRTERIVEIKSLLIERDREPAVLAFARDVTPRKRIEQELVRADRLASIGMLAAAVAHEINNPLTYANLCLQLLHRELPSLPLGDQRERILEHVANATHGVERVATIVRDLRAFSRPDDGELGRVDVIASLEQAIKLVGNDVRHRARIVREYEDPPPVKANASRLEQVFVNVLINAAQAIGAGSPSQHEIRVAVRNEAADVVIEISDTGPGIAPELRERVFEPFFSTKEIGVGTGLGLAVCRSIVEQFGGKILAEAAARGTRMTIRLPIYLDAPPPTLRAPSPDLAKSERRLRVLVVDDEPLVRTVLASVLGNKHCIMLAEHGRHALELLSSAIVDVVVCDVMMPVMNGIELYEHLAKHQPVLARRFVFMTGGTLIDTLDEMNVPVLYKPFEMARIAETVAAAAER